MAYITVGSKFTPFTYEEKVRPFVQYNEAYSNIENVYNDLMTKADTVKSSLNEEVDKESYKKYEDLYNELSTAANTLASEGLTKGVRKSLNNIYKNYRDTILPIAKAVDIRDKEYKRRSEAKSKDSSLQFEKETISIDDLVNNPATYDFGREISINDMYNQIAKFASPYADTYRGSSDWYLTADGQVLERKDMYGYSEKEIRDIINGTDKESPLALRYHEFLDNMDIWDWEGMINDEGEYTAKGNAMYNLISNASSYGLSQALGKPKFERVANKNYKGDKDGKDGEPTRLDKLKASAINYVSFGKDQDKINKLSKNGVLLTNENGTVSYSDEYLPKPTKNNPLTQYYNTVLGISRIEDPIDNSANLNATPIDIYKEWDEATKVDRGIVDSYYTNNSFSYRPMQTPQYVIEAKNRIDSKTQSIKSKYNVGKILAPQEYSELTSDSNNGKLDSSYNYTAVSLSSISDSFPDKVNFNKNLKEILKSNVINGQELAKDTIYELTGGLSAAKKKAASSDDFLNPNTYITDIKYSAQYPDSIIVAIEVPGDKKGKNPTKKHYAVKADAISTRLADLLKDYASIIEYSKNLPKEDWDDDITDAYYNIASAAAYILNPKD